jgi:hypothetical protein
MGGMGSGRGWQGGKKTTDYFPVLDVRRLNRDGLLTPRQVWSTTWSRNGKELASIQMESEVDRVILNYQSRNRINGGDSQHMQYPVYLEWTNCHLGGETAMVSLSTGWMRAARCNSLRRYRLRLSPLPQAGLCLTAANQWRSTITAYRQIPAAAWVGCWHPQPARWETQRHALAHIQATGSRA